MAYGDKFNIYLIDIVGNYITASPNVDGTYSIAVHASTDPLADGFFLKNLPKEWDKTEITWERNTTYHGVFRSMSTRYNFVLDGRAIMLWLYSQNNTQAYCSMRIDVLNEASNTGTPGDVWKYDTLYVSQIDFSEFEDDKQQHILTVSTIDSHLYTLLKSNFNKSFNIPYWEYSGSAWTPAANVDFLYHPGCKLYWQNNWISGAETTSTITPPSGSLYGFNHGSVSDARHWIPNMNQYSKVQNNGTTTFIGNDVLQPFIIPQDQAFNYNRNFEGVDDIQAYTKNRGLVKNLLQNPSSTDVVSMNFTISGEFAGPITYSGGGVYTNQFIGFVIFEIDNQDLCTTVLPGNYTYTAVHYENLPPGGGPYTPPAPFTDTRQIDMKYDHTYILGIIYDDHVTGISGVSATGVALSNLELKIESLYNSGTSTPVNGPRFTPSTFPAIRANSLGEKLVGVIDSIQTDPYGFPLGGGAYSFSSSYLSDTTALRSNDYDLKAYNLMFSSENAARLVTGQPYMTLSLSDYFNALSKISNIGLGIVNGDTIIMEPLTTLYDPTTLIYDFGTNVSKFKITPLTDLKADHIKAGYPNPATNNNYGVDSFMIPTEYATLLVNTPKDWDLSPSSVIVDQNQIEKARAQVTTQEQSNPSSNNGLILIDTDDPVTPGIIVVDPGGNPQSISAVAPMMYPSAQNATSGTQPYVNGLYYPDTAINLSITPASNMRRLGPLLNSIADATNLLVFRKQYQMQYNNTVGGPAAAALPGISKNLNSTFIQEVADIPLPIGATKLFRPEIFTLELSTPVNLYNIVNTNPYGYMQFTWINPYTGVGTVYKGFLWKASQKIGNNASTTVTLLAHPDTSDADIAAA